MLAEAGDNPDFRSFPKILEQLEKDGNEAYTTKNHKAWAEANESLNKAYARINDLVDPHTHTDQDLPPTFILKQQGLQEVDRMKKQLKDKRGECKQRHGEERYVARIKSRGDEIAKKLDKMEADIEKIDDELKPEQGLAQVQVALRSQDDLEKKKIPQLGADVV